MTPEESLKIEKWYKEAKGVNDLEGLLTLLSETTECKDWDSKPHAVVTSMLGTLSLMSKETPLDSDRLNSVFWLLVRELTGKEGPMAILEFENMLYPFMERDFEKAITKNTMKYLQEKAGEFLKDGIPATKEVIEHWQSLVDGNPPFGYKVRE